LKTVTSDAIKRGLAKAVDTGKPVVNCLTQAAEEDLLTIPKEHYLVREHLE
jgi:stearoyl-CoA desaturase (Delta-9 desaturase)